jgi:hypothetical protein
VEEVEGVEEDAGPADHEKRSRCKASAGEASSLP